ncbi:WD repeat-containing protein 24 [Mortierella sp. GBA43]|nr:WD repeat-containing protein 24 [Mortierella sp. GBA43]
MVDGSRRKAPGSTPYTFRYDTNGALSALSASPDFTRVAVVGRDVLKILSVTEHGAEELIDLKTVGIRNNFAGSTDVKWGPTTGNGIGWRPIFTSSRRVKTGLLNWAGMIFLPVGQDAKIATIGTIGPILIWDIGTQNKIGMALDRRNKPALVMEAKDIVREVQFNPVSMNDIRWDVRNPSISERKFMAHMGFVTSLDYHPSGRFLASGGRDKTIKVWDMEDDKRRELHTIPTIQYTSKVQWRPNKAYHIAASFKDEPTVQVFDVRRPFVPLHVLARHDKDITTSILWKDTDILWTVSKDKTFTSTHMKGQTLASSLLPGGKAAMNCYGQLAFTISNKGNHDIFEKGLVPRPGRPNVKSVALDGSSEATIYRARQTGGVIDCELFNHEAFIYCAQNYSTEAGNVRVACEHNANVAWQANRFRDSQAWMAIKLFYSDMAESAMVVSQVDASLTDTATTDKQKEEQTQDEDDLNSWDPRTTKPAMPSLFAIKVSDLPIKRHWTHEDTIRSLLEYYAEQGDVQMCVTILLVLADEKDVPEFNRSQQWFGSYIDLLSRFKLWSIATAVSQACKDPDIHTMNQESTTIHTSCSSCLKNILTRAPTSSGFWACDRCQKILSSCSICHKTVRGIFTWCAQCSHGFHLQHAQEWFSQSAECPTGCGHQCFPEMLKVQQDQELQQPLHQWMPDSPLQYPHPRPLHLSEQVSYPTHGHHRPGEVSESKGSSPLPYTVV